MGNYETLDYKTAADYWDIGKSSNSFYESEQEAFLLLLKVSPFRCPSPHGHSVEVCVCYNKIMWYMKKLLSHDLFRRQLYIAVQDF